MSLKGAALLAFVGMMVLTVLLTANFLRDLSAFLQGALAVIAVLTSLIHLFAALCVTVFFFVFHRAQS